MLLTHPETSLKHFWIFPCSFLENPDWCPAVIKNKANLAQISFYNLHDSSDFANNKNTKNSRLEKVPKLQPSVITWVR